MYSIYNGGHMFFFPFLSCATFHHSKKKPWAKRNSQLGIESFGFVHVQKTKMKLCRSSPFPEICMTRFVLQNYSLHWNILKAIKASTFLFSSELKKSSLRKIVLKTEQSVAAPAAVAQIECVVKWEETVQKMAWLYVFLAFTFSLLALEN